MHDATSFSDNSPFSSPRQSPVISPSSSRGTSPTPSPKLRKLRRANSYRKGKKSALSNIDSFLRRRTLLHRDRSQSDTDISNDKQGDGNGVKMRCQKKSVSAHDMQRKSKLTCPESDSFDKTEAGRPDRKKSLSLILDFKRLMELSPKPSRASKKSKAVVMTTSDEETEEYDGPLFQATTLFVPGYDFKTKQSTVDRPSQPKGFLTRRGSKDKSLISLLDRVQSSPSLIRRGSKPERNASIDSIKHKSKYTRCDSTPVATGNKGKNTIRPETRQVYSEVGLSEYLSVSERSSIIAQRHRSFQDLKRSKSSVVEQPDKLIPRGSVKKIMNTFEDGSIFEMNVTQRRKDFATSKLRHSGDFDQLYRSNRHRSGSLELDEGYRKRSYTSYESYVSKNGGESGYASPTESTASEASAYMHPAERSVRQPDSLKRHPLINITSLGGVGEDLPNSWSYSQWQENHHNVRSKNYTSNYLSDDSELRCTSTYKNNNNNNNNNSQYYNYDRLLIPTDLSHVCSTDFCTTDL